MAQVLDVRATADHRVGSSRTICRYRTAVIDWACDRQASRGQKLAIRHGLWVSEWVWAQLISSPQALQAPLVAKLVVMALGGRSREAVAAKVD
jgi:hypothetical protein